MPAQLSTHKTVILRVGPVAEETVQVVRREIPETLRRMECVVLEETMPIPEDTFNPARNQYCSSEILGKIVERADLGGDYVLGVTDVDLYVPGLNFVFGEASSSGRVALISLLRLRQEFYGLPSDTKLYHERAVKEAVHEIGHIIGLKHCRNPYCVMFFSNIMADTDRKRRRFCKRCNRRVSNIL